MNLTLGGIHHVTAIAGDPQRNVDFYAGVLGLRLVKRTVNFDDPGTYHLYYGDAQGSPGTLLTFFAWPGGGGGQRGLGQFTSASLAIPVSSLGFWIERLLTHGVAYTQPSKRFGEQVLAFKDPDGLPLEIVATPLAGPERGEQIGDVPPRHAIRGVHAVELWDHERAGTADFLVDRLGFRLVQESANRRRYAVAGADSGAKVDLVRATGFWGGTIDVGSIHHVAWRTPDDGSQLAWRDHLIANGVEATQVRDRQYFHSIYFNEPGGALFEIATDAPGFAVDEAAVALGTSLKLPPWLEQARTGLEMALPPLRYPPSPGIAPEGQTSA